ncbi:MAG TPA: hypothetical protein VN428_02850 [Bryobacteraceae bacterium]|nr:hypothetical protein [Bryobacteraceae bacterium]
MTLIQEAGATPLEAAAQAGHTRTSMTQEYTVIGIDRREDAVVKVQKRLFGDSLQAAQVA